MYFSFNVSDFNNHLWFLLDKSTSAPETTTSSSPVLSVLPFTSVFVVVLLVLLVLLVRQCAWSKPKGEELTFEFYT